ncbi:cytochrome P450 [Backusella circina FSU 941]|nr:cytochrome P450 [Backusella circina FSU 941]
MEQNRLIGNITKHKKIGFTVFIFAVLLLGRYRSKRQKLSNSKDKRNNDQEISFAPNTLPLLGNAYDLCKDPDGFYKRAIEENGPVFKIRAPGIGTVIVVTSIPLITEVLKAPLNSLSFFDAQQRLFPFSRVTDISYGHKYTLNIPLYKEYSIVNYTLRKNLKAQQMDLFEKPIQLGFQQGIQNQFHDLKVAGDTKVVDNTLYFMMNFIANVSCKSLAGDRAGSNPEFIDATVQYADKVVKTGLLLKLLPDWLGNLSVKYIFSVEDQIDTMMRIMIPEIQQARYKLDKGESNYEHNIGTALLDHGHLGSNENPLDPSQVSFIIKGIFLVSITAVSTFLTHCIYTLATNSQLVTDLRQEVGQVNNEIALSKLRDMPLLNSFIKEVLRYKQDHIGLSHAARRDFQLSSGHIIPKDSIVMCALNSAHLYPPKKTDMYCKTPLDEFDPYRYKDQLCDPVACDANYIPFGLGPHICPGKQFAGEIMRYIIAQFVVMFDIQLMKGEEEIKDVDIMGIFKTPSQKPLKFTYRQN